MRILYKIIIASSFILSLLSVQAASLNKQAVEQLIIKFEQAAIAQDDTALMALFHPQAEIFIQINNTGGKLKFDVRGYQQFLRQDWSMPGDYDYQLQNVDITLNKMNDSADVSVTALEKTTEYGSTVMNTQSDYRMQVAAIDDQVLITSLLSQVTMLAAPETE